MTGFCLPFFLRCLAQCSAGFTDAALKGRLGSPVCRCTTRLCLLNCRVAVTAYSKRAVQPDGYLCQLLESEASRCFNFI